MKCRSTGPSRPVNLGSHKKNGTWSRMNDPGLTGVSTLHDEHRSTTSVEPIRRHSAPAGAFKIAIGCLGNETGCPPRPGVSPGGAASPSPSPSLPESRDVRELRAPVPRGLENRASFPAERWARDRADPDERSGSLPEGSGIQKRALRPNGSTGRGVRGPRDDREPSRAREPPGKRLRASPRSPVTGGGLTSAPLHA